MTTGKTIQIYLPDGKAEGLRIAEITSRTVKVLQIPRGALANAWKREELESVGLYFLLGDAADGVILVYVGETEDSSKRLKDHNRKLDWWNTALVCISSSAAFTKTHVKYLEWYCHKEAKEVGRYAVDNTNKPKKPHVSESMEADLMDHFETIRMLCGTLGFPLFEPLESTESVDRFTCKGKQAKATGEYNEKGFVVLEGSFAMKDLVPSSPKSVIARHQELIAAKVLVPNDAQTLKFAKHHVFTSPSIAAAIVLGRNANGWVEWKDKDGKTLDEVKRKD
jgi:hypothetical protein